MRENRIRNALQAIGGAGTTGDITRVLGARPCCISAQLAGMAQRGQVERVGSKRTLARRWVRSYSPVIVTVWRLK